MAEHLHKSYSCDRCKADLGDKRPTRSQAAIVNASFNYIEGPGPSFQWRDLCNSCNAAVKAFFLTSPVDMAVTTEERREARVWWAEVGSYVNREMAEYIMVRARRIMGTWKP